MDRGTYVHRLRATADGGEHTRAGLAGDGGGIVNAFGVDHDQLAVANRGARRPKRQSDGVCFVQGRDDDRDRHARPWR